MDASLTRRPDRIEVSCAVSTLLLLLAAGAWNGYVSGGVPEAVRLAVLLTGLSAAAMLADLAPVHVSQHAKVSVTTVPLFVLAVLLPVPLAALGAGASVLVGEMRTRREYGSGPAEIIPSVARWALLGAVGSLVARAFPPAPWSVAAGLLGAAVLMLLGDVLLASLELAPMSRRRILPVVVDTFRETALLEVCQYLLGIMAAAAALQHPWTLPLLCLPVVVLHVSFQHLKGVRSDTLQLLESMADAVDLRDPYTGGHSRRVAALVEETLQALQITGPDVELIVSAARVHDLGKIGIPDAVLSKPGALTPEEWELMKSHPVRGAELLARNPDFRRGVAIVRGHHERWDGKGYPDGLAGADIPYGARVIAVADSFDAMTSDRPYREGMSEDAALAILREGEGVQWDPEIVRAFLRTRSGHGAGVRPAPSVLRSLTAESGR